MRKKVLVVDDSAYYRRAIIRMLEEYDDIEVVGYARNGKDALKKVKMLKPDVVLLDLEMPEFDGFSFLRLLMAENPLPVIVVSSLSDSENVYRALELGAVDFVPKPTKKISPRIYDIKEELIKRLRAVSKVDLKRREAFGRRVSLKLQEGFTPPSPKIKTTQVESAESVALLAAVAIGASTGGPSALQQVLSGVKFNSNLVIFISQHIPPGFSRAFAERLNRYSEFFVKEAEDGEPVRGGHAYVCPGGYSLTLAGNAERVYVKLELREGERYVPSVDRMMESVGRVFGERSMGILLTGMGNDGVRGMKVIVDAGGYTIAESPETAVIFGMPGEAVKRGVVKKLVALHRIAQEINQWGSRWTFKLKSFSGGGK